MKKVNLQNQLDEIVEALNSTSFLPNSEKNISIIDKDDHTVALMFFLEQNKISLKIELSARHVSFDLESAISDNFFPKNKFPYSLLAEKLKEYIALVELCIHFRDKLDKFPLFASNQK